MFPKFPTDTALAAVMVATAPSGAAPQDPPARRGPGRPPGARNKLPAAYIPAALAEGTNRTVPPPIDRPWSVSGWCTFVGLGRTTFYVLKKRGLTPDELIVGGKHFITRESHQKWVKRNTVKARPQPEAP